MPHALLVFNDHSLLEGYDDDVNCISQILKVYFSDLARCIFSYEGQIPSLVFNDHSLLASDDDVNCISQILQGAFLR